MHARRVFSAFLRTSARRAALPQRHRRLCRFPRFRAGVRSPPPSHHRFRTPIWDAFPQRAAYFRTLRAQPAAVMLLARLFAWPPAALFAREPLRDSFYLDSAYKSTISSCTHRHLCMYYHALLPTSATSATIPHLHHPHTPHSCFPLTCASPHHLISSPMPPPFLPHALPHAFTTIDPTIL